MPAYCGSCPYNNRFCKSQYVSEPTCPMGYNPISKDTKDAPTGKLSAEEDLKHVLEPDILLKIGKTAVNKNDYNTGIECFEKILELEPANTQASFLLKRAKYMVKEGPSGESEEQKESKETSAEVKEPEQPKGMLPQMEAKSISIKPKQMAQVDPNMIIAKNGKVYHVHEEDAKEGKLKEDVSKHVARKSKGSIMSKKGTMIVLMLAVGLIIMIVVGLWWFGFLKF